MTKFLRSENHRKDKLFFAWSDYLDHVHEELAKRYGETVNFNEFYDDLATVTGIGLSHIDLSLASGEAVYKLPVSPEICASIRHNDMLFIIMGKLSNKWWPLDITTITSMLPAKGEVHFSVNPELICETRRLPQKFSRLPILT